MQRLDNEIRNYAWGSRRVLADFTGRPSPSDQPEAEIWLGAHPTGSSRFADLPERPRLADAINADPKTHLGAGLYTEYGQLPFLFKVMSAEMPLSLKAHPSSASAKDGFAREEANEIPLDDPRRNYVDPLGKPELYVAVSTCDVLVGFRPAPAAAEAISALGVSMLAPYVASLLTEKAADGMRTAVTTLLSMPEKIQQSIAAEVVEQSRRLVAQRADDESALQYQWVVELGEKFPGDIGIVVSLLMNLVRLAPGQAVFIPPGTLHTFLRGCGMEVQSNSDNTLRGGLTTKHVDVVELLKVIDFEPDPDPVIDAVVLPDDSPYCPGARTWPTTAREFALFEWQIDGSEHQLRAEGPQILLVVDGELELRCGEQTMRLCRGQSVYVRADEPTVTATGRGRLAQATAGQVPRSR